MRMPRHALVTGSGRGIGRAVVGALLDGGWQVTGLDLEPGDTGSPGLRAIRVDLTEPAELDAAVTGALAAGGPVGALIHAAGVMSTAPLGRLDAQAGHRMWQIHVEAAARLADRLLPPMAERGEGRAVLVGSRVAGGMAGRSQYAACKAALLAMARSWAAETVSSGVTVNVVSPAATRTAMLDDPARAGTAPRVPPLGRLIEPEEVAALVVFLLSPAAAPITGQDLQLCGGASLAR